MTGPSWLGMWLRGGLDPDTGRARLSYRRAAELFTHATPGWTLHDLRHSALTHAAEDGMPTPMLMTKSGHASIRTLSRYSRPSVDALARWQDGPWCGPRGPALGQRSTN